MPDNPAPSTQERINFWKVAYARASFVDARIFTEQILKTNMALDNPLRKALSIAVLTTYCRPFKQRELIRLPEDIVPPVYRNLHNSMIEQRDKVVAHRDLDGPVADWGFVSQLELSVEGNGMAINTISPTLTNERATEMLPLLNHVIEKMDQSANEFAEKFLVQLAGRQGTHVLCLDDATVEWTKEIDPVMPQQIGRK